MKGPIKLIATDPDGTLLKDNKSVSDEDFNTLKELKERGIITVAATGRSLQKVKEVLPSLPFDYIVFSSGSGIYDCQTNTIVMSSSFSKQQSLDIIETINELDENYIVFNPIPHNDTGYYKSGSKQYNYFTNLVESYQSMPMLNKTSSLENGSGQFLIVIDDKITKFEMIKEIINLRHNPIKVIRATSPINGRDIWIELFKDGVSKGEALKQIADHLNIKYDEIGSIGNDYNDIDMLDMTPNGYIVDNAPADLKRKYKNIYVTNNESSLSELVKKVVFFDVEALVLK